MCKLFSIPESEYTPYKEKLTTQGSSIIGGSDIQAILDKFTGPFSFSQQINGSILEINRDVNGGVNICKR